jgi:putative effector of murein hydrolase
MSSRSNNNSGGIGFVGLLTIAFIVLKLTKAIKWSWWWVLSPIWISIAVGLSILLLVAIAYLIYKAVKGDD